MRSIFSLCALAAVGLVGCTGAQQVSSSPPTVSYQVTSGDLTDANVKAANYCQRYGSTARLMSATAGQATYQCIGGGSPGVATVPPTMSRPYVAPVGTSTVSYRVIGNDISSANARAMNYCGQQGRSAHLQSIVDGTAYYTCM